MSLGGWRLSQHGPCLGMPLWPIMVPSSGSPASLAGQMHSGSNTVQTWLSHGNCIQYCMELWNRNLLCSETLHGFAAVLVMWRDVWTGHHHMWTKPCACWIHIVSSYNNIIIMQHHATERAVNAECKSREPDIKRHIWTYDVCNSTLELKYRDTGLTTTPTPMSRLARPHVLLLFFSIQPC